MSNRELDFENIKFKMCKTLPIHVNGLVFLTQQLSFLRLST